MLVTLAPVTYPSLAKQTRISGDVRVYVEVDRNGSVETTRAMQGHPLLAETALASAKQSQYACRNCPEEGMSLLLVFSFEISFEPEQCPGDKTTSGPEKSYPVITQSENHITVTEPSLQTCDPAEKIVAHKVRSAKCLYLWRCRKNVLGVE